MRRVILACICWVAVLPSVQAADRYYVVFFASQDSSNQPRLTHTFATFLKIDREDGTGKRLASETAQSVTISWLPASGSFRILERPVTGRNFTLQESLAWADERGLRTTARGPFEIGKDVYDRALEQKNRLESGAILYKAVDRRVRPDIACNCTHAVSDILPGPLLMTGTARGDDATAMVANHYRAYLIDPDRTHAAVLQHLDLNSKRIFFLNSSTNRAKNGVAE